MNGTSWLIRDLRDQVLSPGPGWARIEMKEDSVQDLLRPKPLMTCPKDSSSKRNANSIKAVDL